MSSNLVLLLTIVLESEKLGILCTCFYSQEVENCLSFIASTMHTNFSLANSLMQMYIFKGEEGIILSTEGLGQCHLQWYFVWQNQLHSFLKLLCFTTGNEMKFIINSACWNLTLIIVKNIIYRMVNHLSSLGIFKACAVSLFVDAYYSFETDIFC